MLRWRCAMTIRTCEACGKSYDDVAEDLRPHARRVYDPFECAVHRAARRCPFCGCPLIPVPHDRTTDEPVSRKTGAALAIR
jgi:Zn-finger protein